MSVFVCLLHLHVDRREHYHVSWIDFYEVSYGDSSHLDSTLQLLSLGQDKKTSRDIKN